MIVLFTVGIKMVSVSLVLITLMYVQWAGNSIMWLHLPSLAPHDVTGGRCQRSHPANFGLIFVQCEEKWRSFVRLYVCQCYEHKQANSCYLMSCGDLAISKSWC